MLHQLPSADVVAFLDFDQELLAPRYRAAEQALALLVRGATARGHAAARAAGAVRLGCVLVQTRLPHHEVIQAARATPIRRGSSAAERRAASVLQFPPVSAMAAVSGCAAPTFIEALRLPAPASTSSARATASGCVRAPDHPTLCDALAATPRPRGRLRVEVDPASHLTPPSRNPSLPVTWRCRFAAYPAGRVRGWWPGGQVGEWREGVHSWRRTSYIAMDAAVATLSEPILPSMGR